MAGYLIRRTLQGVIVVIGVALITFIIPVLFHGNVASAVLGSRASQAELQQFNRLFGLNQPVYLQLYHYVVRLLHGNLGRSMGKQTLGGSVNSIIGSAIWRTIWLALVSLILSLVIAIPLGLFQALRRNSLFDYGATGMVFVIYSTPTFLLGILLIALFSINWHVFPPFVGANSANFTGTFGPLVYMIENPRQFVLPVAVLTGLTVGGFSRFMRGSVLDSLIQDYVRTARAKGASSRRVLFRHAFRNAVIPVLTILGLTLPGLFGGALITETLFNYQGMGLLAVSSFESQDINVVMGITLLIAITTVIGNLIADVSLSMVDPRVRLTGTR